MADLQRELKIRRRVESVYNKRQEDFASPKDFGDYEEEKEDIIFNLAQGIDVDAMEAKIATYHKQNYDEIIRNEAQKAELKRLKVEEQAPKAEAATAPPTQQGSESDKVGVPPPTLLQPSLPPAPVIVDSKAHSAENASEPHSPLPEREAMGLASGWTPDMQRRRALEEAFSTTFVS